MTNKIYHSILLLFINLGIIYAQTPEIINLDFDTSGYENNQSLLENRINASPIDVIPTVNAELNVNDAGALTFLVPFEVFKGVNSFQPNIGLSYNSQSNGGHAGFGWNIVGLSTITRGGKNKLIDGIAVGPQFNSLDPYYLDGQRLLSTNQIDFVTEKYSKIKVTKEFSSPYSFTIQYPDGKVAKYVELITGQHYISLVKDALDNEIHYTYFTETNVPYLNSISYGGSDVSNDTFFINLLYKSRITQNKTFRNGNTFVNSKIIDEIIVSSTYLTANNGLYRKYKLFYDLIQNNTAERLIKIEVSNESGQKLKPLLFGYNNSTTGQLHVNSYNNIGLTYETKGLGSVIVGDFYGNGQPTPIYEIKEANNVYKLMNPKSGVLATYANTRRYYAGRPLINNKVAEEDQLITTDLEMVESTANNQLVTPKLNFTFRNLITNTVSKTITIVYPDQNLFPVNINPNAYDFNFYQPILLQDIPERKIFVSDYNNDGLSDAFIIEQVQTSGVPRKLYFAEIGLLPSGTITPIEISGTLVCHDNTDIYQIEFDGDGVPDLLVVDKLTDHYSVYKIDLASNSLITLISDNLMNPVNYSLNDFAPNTPLIFGDYNGDGLTDFVTPKRLFSIEGSSSAAELQKIETEPLLWWEYIATGTGYIVTQKDYTQQKLAYIVPSQRNVIKRSTTWEKFWSGTPDTYDFTEYGSSTIIPADINKDGKTDLISVRKFGRVKYSETGKLFNTQVMNQYDFGGIDPNNANKILLHVNKTSPNGSVTLTNLSTQLSLVNTLVSPLSLILNAADGNSYNTYNTTLYVHDPLIKVDRTYKFLNDEFTEGLLQTINNGSPVLQKIEYKPMAQIFNTNASKVYIAENLNLDFPFYVHKNIGTNYIVNKIHLLFDSNIITTEYRYKNGIQHLAGKGYIGFQTTMVSDPYESKILNNKYVMKDIFKGVFWTVKKNDPYLENAMIETTYGSLNSTILTKTTNTSQRFDKGNNRYLILPILNVNTDYLKNASITKSYQYDTSGDLLLREINTDFGGVAASTEIYSYQPEFSNGDHYFFGKVIKSEIIASRDGITFRNKTEQSYNNNGTIYQLRKYGNGTTAGTYSNPVLTDFTYYPFGGLETETISTVGVADTFTTSYEYDSTNRFIWQITSPDLSLTTKNYSPIGRLLSEVSPLGLTTSFQYDSWGNVNQITDYLGKITSISKTFSANQPAGNYQVVSHREGGIITVVTHDKFDRVLNKKTQSIGDQWINVSIEYDVFGKKIKESQPYFDGEAPLWNLIEYDELSRPVKQTSFNGKVINSCYEGLKVSVEDGIKKTTKWLDITGKTIRHKDGGGEIFYKYYPNGSLKETNYDGIKTKIEIDGWGNKTKLEDPSAGIYLYEYDNLGRIKKETNPKGGITQYTYDSFSRPLSENTISTAENTNSVKNFAYDPTTHLPTTVSGTYNGKFFEYTTFYNDPFFRVTGKKEQTAEFTYETEITYDSFGRTDVAQMTTTLLSPSYVSTSSVKNVYDDKGILTKQLNNLTNNQIWEVNEINSHGLTTLMTLGNGYTVQTNYNNSTLSLEKIIHQKNSNTVVDIDFTYDSVRGILTDRVNNIFNKTEHYEYDDLDRLLEERTNGIVIQNYTYDTRGRMTSNTSIGKYNYNDQNYKLESINYNSTGAALNSSRGFADISYNSFKNPNEIFLAGKDRISYDYNILKTRSVSYYGSQDATATNRPNRKYYSADKTIEVIKEGTITKIITYITGDPYSANYIKVDILNGNSPISNDNYFLHRDNQGTILAITKADTNATLIEKRYFDAWGNLSEAKLGNSTTVVLPNSMGWVNQLLLDRGYTGHEHLKTVGLIHMNGRIYDPQLRRFMSPDNFVQDLYDTQKYNRFGYVWNNPLLYTDPSGELGFIAAVVIAVVVAVVVNGITNMLNGTPFWYGMGKSGTMGAISGAISFGIGAVVSTAFSTAQAAAVTLKEAALSAVGQVVGSFLPNLDIKLGDFTFSLNIALFMGNSNGIGLNFQMSYIAGDVNFSYGFGVVGYTKYQNTGKSGFQYRNSFMVGYDDGNIGTGIGTNFFKGSGGMAEFKQRTSIISFRKGDFSFSYENDGSPFSYAGKTLSNNTDIYRTAAANIGIGDFSANLNMFTGRSGNDDNCADCIDKTIGRTHRKLGALGIWDNPEADLYRLGALTISYKNYNIGVNSEYIRDGFQNWFAHKIISPQPGFRMLDNNINPFFQYQTRNQYSLW